MIGVCDHNVWDTWCTRLAVWADATLVSERRVDRVNAKYTSIFYLCARRLATSIRPTLMAFARTTPFLGVVAPGTIVVQLPVAIPRLSICFRSFLSIVKLNRAVMVVMSCTGRVCLSQALASTWGRRWQPLATVSPGAHLLRGRYFRSTFEVQHWI